MRTHTGGGEKKSDAQRCPCSDTQSKCRSSFQHLSSFHNIKGKNIVDGVNGSVSRTMAAARPVAGDGENDVGEEDEDDEVCSR